jgi:hypothetical protein
MHAADTVTLQGDLYQLWSGMLTQRTWDRIMEAGEDIESLRVRVTLAVGSVSP